MNRFRSTILWVSLLMLLPACGGGGEKGSIQMGGSIQGRRLLLSPAVSTIAGISTSGSTDGAGMAARFSNPKGVTTDGRNLYVADGTNFTIRKIGIAFANVTTIAGSAGSSGSADGSGPGARFSSLAGITTDGTNLYVVDAGNNNIRQVVIATGVVTTLSGSAGNPGSADGTGAAARFNSPQGISTDGANLYVADSGNDTIRRIAIATGAVTTLAGSPGIVGSTDDIGSSARFSNPQGLTTDGVNLYVTDSGNDTIRRVSIATGAVTTFAGSPGNPGDNGTPGLPNGNPVKFTDGTGGFALFTAPSAITSDGVNLYVTDDGSMIRKIVINTGVVTTIAGIPGIFGATDGTGDYISYSYYTSSLDTTPGDARFWQPQGLTTDGKYLYVADSANNMIRKVH